MASSVILLVVGNFNKVIAISSAGFVVRTRSSAWQAAVKPTKASACLFSSRFNYLHDTCVTPEHHLGFFHTCIDAKLLSNYSKCLQDGTNQSRISRSISCTCRSESVLNNLKFCQIRVLRKQCAERTKISRFRCNQPELRPPQFCVNGETTKALQCHT